MSMNKVLLFGNLGRDPELRYTNGGQAVANFTLATSEKWGGKDGKPEQEKTEWHRIVVWGRQAENCQKFLTKGSQALIEGRIQSRDWEDKEGNKRTSTEIVAQRVQFVGGGKQQGQQGQQKQQGGKPEWNENDIPF